MLSPYRLFLLQIFIETPNVEINKAFKGLQIKIVDFKCLEGLQISVRQH